MAVLLLACAQFLNGQHQVIQLTFHILAARDCLDVPQLSCPKIA